MSVAGPGRYHLVGIGGAGMSAIARVLMARGCQVSGSDANPSETTRALEREGAQVFEGHAARHVEGAGTVVVSSAVPPGNPEVKRARELGIPVVPRMDMLARLMASHRGVGVAGSHGKTTTTAMVGLALLASGADPTVLVGGEVREFGGNTRVGSGEYLVAEVDESDGGFVRLKPHSVLITNVEDDHLECYGSMANMVRAFEQFLDAACSGVRVVCRDDPRLRRMAEERPGVVTYGLSGEPDFVAADLRVHGLASRFRVLRRGEELGEVRLSVPGVHNVSNALGALALTASLGFPFGPAARALGGFGGVRRRFETVGRAAGVWVVDDYGHHPTEMAATLRVARSVAEGRLVCVFQPHRYTRTRQLHRELGAALSWADLLVVTDVYPAGEAPIPGVSARLVAEAAEKAGAPAVHFVPDRAEVAGFLAQRLRPGDLVLTLGAGNVWTVGRDLLRRLEAGGPGEGAGDG
ncbi:MAG: UDP-N-acetylmuramate--L-alanine ligase [Acetobacteraceae bacterium]|nr:UDP-N-acetylmuramate--L-alanine ligase [Acetobacteraceae bacterium]